MKRKISKITFVLVVILVSACGPAVLPVTMTPIMMSPSPLPPTFLSPAIIPTGTPMADCTQIPPSQPIGALINVEFENQSGGDVNFSFGMIMPNNKNECGTYSYTIPESNNVSTQIMASCYWGYGWIDGGEGTGVTKTDPQSPICIWDTTITYHILITKEAILLQK